jgi:hypothetical protein
VSTVLAVLMALAATLGVVMLGCVTGMLLGDLVGHVRRYRGYLRSYPAARDRRGQVWRHTA